ncbi:hypothetical protein OQY15_18275 [Pedobacter sp. MC2016-15]|uniref:hypothetical protein n=1 Tax=Pedobacter sp. MC2016-15 TaxID=2994473 RepID=UPI00224861C1|nr:hypothetical protein [Pedobacter sp. MC2016-15]MCX2481057.1 hypothetical protein [Pedobacter sp. MC2016-15]
MDILGLMGLVSSIIGIASFFLPDSWRSKKRTIFICIILTSMLSGYIVYQYNALSRIRKVSKAAQLLMEGRQMNFGYRGYVQASLAFLEQNKDLYPDSYERAKMIALERKNESSVDDIEAASSIDGIIRGIAIINIDK